MSGHRIKEIAEATEFRNIIKEVKDAVILKSWEIPDRIGPVKLDVLDQLLQSYLGTMPVVAQHIDAIEEHLEKGAGKPFIRLQERPDVGASALQELTEGVRSLSERLGKLESRVK